jgi:hypothetical protein
MGIGSWLKQTISVASVTSVDATGKLVYGSPRSVSARVEPSRRMVRKQNGDDVQSTHRIYSLDAILINDRVWLPGLSSSTVEGSKTPLAVTAPIDKNLTRTLYTVDL